MALRIPWDIEEAVLLLDQLLQSLNGDLPRSEAIKQVSIRLRKRAIDKGIEIDDVFRNENGIAFQMSAMEVAYTGVTSKLKQPSKLFLETVDLYKNHREHYEEILMEVNGVNDEKSAQEEFFLWLSTQQASSQLSDIYFLLTDIEDFCLKRNILQKKLFETTDIETINRVVLTVDSDKVFRFTHKRNLKRLSKAIHAYHSFIKYNSKLSDQTRNEESLSSAKTLSQGVEKKDSFEISKKSSAPNEISLKEKVRTQHFFVDFNVNFP